MGYKTSYGIVAIIAMMVIAVVLRQAFNPTGAKILAGQPISYVLLGIIAVVVGIVSYVAHTRYWKK